MRTLGIAIISLTLLSMQPVWAGEGVVLTVANAKKIVSAAVVEAKKRNVGGSIAVVDATGYLIYLERIDGSFPASASVATQKARTAALFGMPTQRFEEAVNNGRFTLTAVPEVLPLEGGVPLIVDGRILGAVGVSGASSSKEDVEFAEIAVKAFYAGREDD